VNGRRIVLGVSGGIAAYKAAALASASCSAAPRSSDPDRGRTAVRRAATFAALVRRPVHTSLWERVEEIPHIRLARRLKCWPSFRRPRTRSPAGGRPGARLLGNVALATRAPLMIAPAMNTVMLEHAATQANLATLRARGVTIVEPGVGFLAEPRTRPRALGR